MRYHKRMKNSRIEQPSQNERPDSKQELPLAHPGKRYQGQAIDFGVCLFLFGLSIAFTNYFDVSSQIAGFFIFGVPLIYFVLADALPNGQSLGKRMMGLAVVSKSTGKSCTLLQSCARNGVTPLLGVIDYLVALGKGRQRLGDRVANTVVINTSQNIPG